MASLRKEIFTNASSEQAWDALRDVGALHTRLVPGFVVDTRLEPGARIVTFGNGMVIREPIVTIDEEVRRIVWSAIAEGITHYNGSAQVFAEPGGGAKILWTADFLPHEAENIIRPMMEEGSKAMRATLDRLVE
jgi:hypothetical protein